MRILSQLGVISLMSVVLAGCGAGPEKRGVSTLNSDRIQARYGSFGIELLPSPADVRIASLYSEDAGMRTARTYAVTRLANVSEPALRDADAAIRAGGSIGKTLREAGFVIGKETIDVAACRLDPSEHARAATAMRLNAPAVVAMRVYELYAERDGLRTRYATIAEVHHPDYLTPQALAEHLGISAPDQTRTAFPDWVAPHLAPQLTEAS